MVFFFVDTAGDTHRFELERREIEGTGPFRVLQVPQIPVEATPDFKTRLFKRFPPNKISNEISNPVYSNDFRTKLKPKQSETELQGGKAPGSPDICRGHARSHVGITTTSLFKLFQFFYGVTIGTETDRLGQPPLSPHAPVSVHWGFPIWIQRGKGAGPKDATGALRDHILGGRAERGVLYESIWSPQIDHTLIYMLCGTNSATFVVKTISQPD